MKTLSIEQATSIAKKPALNVIHGGTKFMDKFVEGVKGIANSDTVNKTKLALAGVMDTLTVLDPTATIVSTVLAAAMGHEPNTTAYGTMLPRAVAWKLAADNLRKSGNAGLEANKVAGMKAAKEALNTK